MANDLRGVIALYHRLGKDEFIEAMKIESSELLAMVLHNVLNVFYVNEDYDPGKLAWPMNLIAEVVQDNDTMAYFVLPCDWEYSINYILSTLQGHERDVILFRYKEKKSLSEIGQLIGFTRERARQVAASGIIHLRNQSRKEVLLYGISEAMARRANQHQRDSEMKCVAVSEITNLEAMLINAYNAGKHNKELADMLNRYVKGDDVITESYERLLMPLEKCNMSVRLFNALHRAGYEVIGQAYIQDDATLQCIQNIGVLTMKELKMLLEHLSLTEIDRIAARRYLFNNGYTDTPRPALKCGTIPIMPDRAFLNIG